MRIDHLAIWVSDLELMRSFYENYFQATSSDRYHNPSKSFTSYFLSFPDSATRVELMHKPEYEKVIKESGRGLAHFAIALGQKDFVDQMTEKLRHDGFKVVGEPRTTGDGYYESVILDPEGNTLELTV